VTYRPALYCTRRPGPPLDRFVERLWYWECEPLAHTKDRMMPDGSCGLVINLYEDETRSYSGAAHDTLRERILAAPTPHAKLQLLEAELLQRAIRPLQRRAEVDYAIARLSAAPSDYTIAMLSEHVGLSARRFTRLFTLEVGLTPKVYARVQRFQRVMECMQGPTTRNWTELAQDCGYFDQSHLIRECRSMSGFTPTELAARRIVDSHHVALT